jgi:glutathione S-transferase
LDGKDYLTGNHYSVADISCIATVSTLVVIKIFSFTFLYLKTQFFYVQEALRVSPDKYPRVQAWIQRCRDNLPGYHEANQVGLEKFKSAISSVLDA